MSDSSSARRVLEAAGADHAKYLEIRKVAQDKANATGCDHGIEQNKLFRTYREFLLPMAKFRTGHELRCEVVHPELLASTRPGHGYADTSKQPCGWHGGGR